MRLTIVSRYSKPARNARRPSAFANHRLIWASGRSHEDAVKILIESGADKIALDYTSFTTPLEMAEDEVNENVILPWVKRRPIIVTRSFPLRNQRSFYQPLCIDSNGSCLI